MHTLISLRGIVGRTRFNKPGSNLPLVQAEYVKRTTQLKLIAEPNAEPEWTTARDEAQTFDWDVAEQLAARIGFPAHALTVSSTARKSPEFAAPQHAHHVEPEETYRLYEKQHLA